MADENMGFETRELTEEQKKQIQEAMDKFADTRDERKNLAQATAMKNQKLLAVAHAQPREKNSPTNKLFANAKV